MPNTSPANTTSANTNPAPGLKKYPDHRITLEPLAGMVRVEAFGQTIAEAAQAIVLREAGYQPVIYLPRDDVRFDLLQANSDTTYCPFKGQARYWDIQVGDDRASAAVWGYDNPYNEVAQLAGYVAFYPDRVEKILLNGQPLMPKNRI